MMKRLLCAGLAAGLLVGAGAEPAKAWGGGVVFGTVLGLGVGTVIGASIARPYPYYPYGYYPYGYYAPAYAYPAPFGYAYPAPPVSYAPPAIAPAPAAAPPGYAPTGYAPTGYAPTGYAPTGYAPTGTAPPAQPARTPACRPGQFFNTLTGTCDTR